MVEVIKTEDNKKKWLLGCGGCLVALTLLSVTAIAVGIGFWNQFQNTSNQTVEAIFGSKPPAGYTNIGIPVPDKNGQKNNVVLMINPTNQQMVIAMDTIIPSADAEILQGKDAKKIEEFIKRFASNDLETATASGGKSVDVKNLHIEGQHHIKLTNGKSFPSLHLKIENSNEYTPAVAGLLVKADNRLTLLLAMEPTTSTTNVDMDFKASYDKLTSQVANLVNETSLDDQILSTGK